MTNSTKPKIKICGITSTDDAKESLRLGADVLGFNFYKPSPRYISPEDLKNIMQNLPAETISAGIFVNASIEEIQTVLDAYPLTIIQLHGDEDNEFCKQVKDATGQLVMKALRIREKADLAKIDQFDTDYLLLDAFHESMYGGSGETFDWSWLDELQMDKIFLAGGIRPDNIQTALSCGTYGIDLCSGVERIPGLKDYAKLSQLFRNIQDYYQND